MSPAAQLTLVALTTALFLSAWFAQETVDDWARETGRKPMLHGKGKWSAYMKANRHEMPKSVAKRLSILTWIGYLSVISGLLVLVLDGSHQH
jgi:hypothetical protein